MAFTKSSPQEFEAIVQAVLQVVQDHPDNPLQNPHGKTFAQMERLAHSIGKQVSVRLTEQALQTHAVEQPEHAPCPQCHQVGRLTRKKREIITEDGTLKYLEPAAHCVECRRDFFPDTSRTEVGGAAV